jgi:hypothetical protein
MTIQKDLDDYDPNEWGNVQLPGLSDNKLHSTNWNHITGIKQRNADPKYKESIVHRTQSKEWREANRQSVLKTVQTETWKKNHAEGVKRLANDPEWQQGQKERGQRRTQNQEWKDRKTEASRRLAKDPTWLTNNKLSVRKHCAKPIVTPAGVFAAVVDAGQAYNKIRNFNNGRKWVINQLKVNSKEFYYITKEEYILLTGKDVI